MNRADDGIGIAHSPPLPRGEKGHVRCNIQLRAGPDGLTGGFDVLHAAIWMPTHIDRINIARARLSGEYRLDTRLGKCVPHSAITQHECPSDTIARHEL